MVPAALPARSAPTQVRSWPRRAASSSDTAALAIPATAMLTTVTSDITTPCLLIILLHRVSATFIFMAPARMTHRLIRLSRQPGAKVAFVIDSECVFGRDGQIIAVRQHAVAAGVARVQIRGVGRIQLQVAQ